MVCAREEVLYDASPRGEGALLVRACAARTEARGVVAAGPSSGWLRHAGGRLTAAWGAPTGASPQVSGRAGGHQRVLAAERGGQGKVGGHGGVREGAEGGLSAKGAPRTPRAAARSIAAGVRAVVGAPLDARARHESVPHSCLHDRTGCPHRAQRCAMCFGAGLPSLGGTGSRLEH